MSLIATDVAVHLQEAKRAAARRADRFDRSDEIMVSPDRHSLQAIAEAEQCNRRARIRRSSGSARQIGGAGRLDSADRIRRRKTQCLQVAKRKLGVTIFFVGLLAGKFRKVGPPSSSKRSPALRKTPGVCLAKSIVSCKPAYVSSQRCAWPRSRGASSLGKAGHRRLNNARRRA